MTIDTPRPCQEPMLKKLWQETFGDTDDFVDAFWKTAYAPDRCRCVTVEDKPVSVIYWLDCSYAGHKVAYLYAGATDKAFRGRGYFSFLLTDVHFRLKARGYEGIVLVPGEESLRSFYAGHGYVSCGSIREFTCGAEGAPAQLRRIQAQEYGQLRRSFLPAGSVLQEGQNLDFLNTQAMLFAGNNFLLAARQEGDTLVGLELLGEEQAAPGILQALGFLKGRFRCPGAGRAFAVYLALTQNTEKLPTYFGLAFD